MRTKTIYTDIKQCEDHYHNKSKAKAMSETSINVRKVRTFFLACSYCLSSVGALWNNIFRNFLRLA